MIKLNYLSSIFLVLTLAIVFYAVYLKYSSFQTNKIKIKILYLHFSNLTVSICSIFSFYILSEMFAVSFNIPKSYEILQILFAAIVSTIFAPVLWNFRMKKYLK
ncbi:hypothetical protein [Psychrobacter ciconiae]|uniref:hypothetical protein n=1 Tax=Psychrobacter ciconiae TaxID=1553449 RepID=UPI0019197E6D|nr:hypothetical protein [Psychrobacter ciconiae]